MSGSLGTPIGGGFLGSAGTLPVTVNANIIYVSANGDDAFPGTWIGKPKQTLAAAFAASASGDKVYVLDGVFTDNLTPTVPAGVTVEFANKFVGGLVLRANSVAIVPYHTVAAAFTDPHIAMDDNISAAADAPTYVCNVIDNTGTLSSYAIESGTNSLSNIYIKKAIVNGGTLVYNENGGQTQGELGLVNFTAANSTLVENANGSLGSVMNIRQTYDNGNANCNFVKYNGAAGTVCIFNVTDVGMAGAGSLLTNFPALSTNEFYFTSLLAPSILPDYTNGVCYAFWNTLVANANTAGLAPISTNTGVAVLTDTDPVTYV